MKKICAVLLIVLFLAVFILFETKKDHNYKVLEVFEGDKLCLDLDFNQKCSPDEIVHIKNVNTFPLKNTEKAQHYAKKYGLSLEEAMKLGFLAKKFTENTLLKRNVRLKYSLNPWQKANSSLSPYNVKYKYRFAEIVFQNKDFAKILLENGLAIPFDGKGFNPYVAYENPSKMRANLKQFQYLKLALLDIKYKIHHKPDCPKAAKIKEYSLISLDKIPPGYKKCKYCFASTYANQKKSQKSGTAAIYTLSPQKTFDNVTFFLINPNSASRPSPFCRIPACKRLLGEINASKSSIDFALYGLDGQNEVVEALLQAKKRGVKIRGVVDSKPDNTYIYKDTAKLKENFDIISDSRPAYMHNKFFIFDNKIVFTGTMNISNTGSGGYNANTAVLINDFRTANAYKKEFEQLYSGAFQLSKTDFSQKIKLNDKTNLYILFSPAANPYEKAISQILKNASKEIFVSIFFLTHKDIIQDLIAAKKRGVDVKIIYDAAGAGNMKDKVKMLRNAQIFLKAENWGGKDHEKNMIIDSKILITGSANFSNSGMNKNDENILIFENPDIAMFYRTHFLNLYNSIDEKYLKFTPRAESFESKNSCYDGIDNNFDGKIDSEDIGCRR